MYRRTHTFDSWQTHKIIQRLSEHMTLYGYNLLDLPIIEAAELFLVKAGDQVVNKLFTFERHGQQLALRPEFTAAAAYYYLAASNPQPYARWQFNGYIFEDSSEDLTQNYQRLSMGAELIGMDDALGDAEIISMAAHGLNLIGLEKWYLIIGHIGLIRQMLTQFHLDDRTERFLLSHLPTLKTNGKSYVAQQIEKLLLGSKDYFVDEALTGLQSVVDANAQQMVDIVLDTTYRGTTMGGRTRQDIARRLTQKRQRFLSREQISAALEFLVDLTEISGSPSTVFPQIRKLIHVDDQIGFQILDQWERITNSLLKLQGISVEQIVIQPSLARSWDYYSGIVFELRAEEDIHIGGGGRYDGLMRLLGSKNDIPAVGFAYYVDELLDIIPAKVNSNGLSLTIAFTEDQSAEVAIVWAEALRSRGVIVQILPVIPSDEVNAMIMTAKADGVLQWEEHTYKLEAIDQLIAETQKSITQ